MDDRLVQLVLHTSFHASAVGMWCSRHGFPAKLGLTCTEAGPTSSRVAIFFRSDRVEAMAGGNRPALLLVDDQPANILALQAVLDDLGATLVCAASGEEALQCVRKAPFAAVLLDVRMPGMDGFETARLIRQLPHGRQLPVIFMTAGDQDEFSLEEAYAFGAVDYITKPFSSLVLRGKVKFFIERFRDTEELKAALAKQTEEQAAAILETISDGFYALDTKWRFTYANRRALDYYGKSREELLGKVVWDVFPMVKGTTFESEYRRAVREQTTVAFEILSPYSHRWVDVRAYPSQEGLACYFRDITEQKRDAEAAAAAKAQIELITNVVPALISYVGTDRRYQLVNDTYETWFGRPRADIVGRHMRELLGEAAWRELAPKLDRAFAGEVSIFEGELPYQHGGTRWVRAAYTPDCSDSGQVRGVVVLVNDITERKRQEDRDRFLAALALATQSLVDPYDVVQTTARLLAEHLKVNRCAYAEVEDEATYVITGDHTREVPSIVGRWPVAAFGVKHHQMMLAGEPYVVSDADSDPRIGAHDLPAYRQAFIQAVVCVPLHKDGRFTAAMAVHQRTARRWREDEVELIRTVVNRCWEALERSRVARILRQSEERLRLVVSNVTDHAILAMGLSGEITDWNPGAEALFGYSREEVLGRSAAILFTPEDQQAGRPKAEMELCRECGTAQNNRWHLRKNGSRFWASGSMEALRGSDGKLRGFVKVVRDRTAQRLAEEALRESEERLKLAVGIAEMGTFEINLETDAVSVNEPGRAIYGWETPFTTFAQVQTHFHPDDRDAVMREVAKALAPDGPGMFEVEHRVYRTNGEVRWIKVRGLGIFEAGKANRCVGTYLDITDRKRTEEALVRQARSLKLLADTATELLSERSIEETIKFALREVTAHLNLDVYFCFLVTEDGKRLRLAACGGVAEEACHGLESLEFGQAVCGVAARDERSIVLENIDQSDNPLSAIVRGLGIKAYACQPMTAQGKTIGTLSVGSKVRTRFTEDELGMLRALAHQIATGYARYQAEAELRAQDQRKDQFIAMLAHELRNPLVPIRNAMYLVSMTREEDTLKSVQEMVNRQVEHLSNIVDDLLEVSRVSTGKVELRRERLNLAQLVNVVVADCRRSFEAAGIGLSVRLPEAPVWVDGDRTRLTQVVENLVSNAAKFTDRGGEVVVAVEPRGPEALVTVRDTGIGIEPDLLPRLFDPFTQADKSLDRSRGGLGLGLALVKGLTELHGGTVSVASQGIGQGSLFTVCLPTTPEPPALAELPVEQPITAAGRLRVLVVEDNRDAAESLRLLLHLCGCEVRLAYTGPDGVQAAIEMKPNLILCDIGLPGLDGYGVAQKLRGAFPGSDQPVLIALTGYGEEDDRRRAAEAGFDRHYTKPVDPAIIQALLRASV